MIKKLLFTLYTTFIFSLLLNNNGLASMSDEKVAAEIANKYNVGETLSEEDQKVILDIMLKNNIVNIKSTAKDEYEINAISPHGTKYFNSNNKGVNLSGVCSYNFWKAPVNSYFNCQVGSYKKKGVNNTATIRHIGYGFGINKSIIKVYDRTFSYSAKREYVTVSHAENYSGLVAYGVFIGTAKVDGVSVSQTIQ